MKRIILFAALAMEVMACDQFNDIGKPSKIENIAATVRVDVTIPEGVPSPENYQVKLTNFSEKYEIVKSAGVDGVVTVEDIIPGIYTITVSSEVVNSGFTYNFNGSLSNEMVVKDGSELVVPVAASKSGSIIFKEIYFCGSKTASGGSYFRDQFYELYNNGDQVQYLDGLCIGNMNPSAATANVPVWDVENAENYVFFLTIWQIPGNGTDYPLAPGESVIIAQMADDHQRAELNPACPVNLITAEFETFVNSTSLIRDNPAVNMTMAFWPSPTAQWLVTVFGGAYGIFYPKEPINPVNYVTPVGSTTKCYKITLDEIVDAVELVQNETKIELKRVPAVLDAGATYVGGTYLGVSVSRKVKETLSDGRVIYKDTNNSSEDFEVQNPPVIRRNNSSIPAWNTWAN
ncbi:MAG: DUF4876 domain-containing protein [Bacteroidales bacterium]